MATGKAQLVDEDLIDITHIVEECAAALSDSDPFICDEQSFSLHDAMAASQLADRKMDCCEIPIDLVAPFGRHIEDHNRTLFPRPAPTGLDGKFTPLKWNDITLEEVLFISLEILVRLQSLLGGASVGESTFTCLYAHHLVLADMQERLFPADSEGDVSTQMRRLMALEQPQGTAAQLFLFAAALALVECTEVVRGVIINADIYEEEDFVANTNQIPFFTENEKSLDTFKVLELALKTVDEMPKDDSVEGLQAILHFMFGFLTVASSMVRGV